MWDDEGDVPPACYDCPDEEAAESGACKCLPENCLHLALAIQWAMCLEHKIEMWNGDCAYCIAESWAEVARGWSK